MLLLNVVLSRFLQANGAGWVFFLTNLFSFFAMIASLNLESGLTFFGSNGSIGLRPLAWSSVAFSFLAVGPIIPFVLIYFHWFPVGIELGKGTLILFALCYIFGIVLSNMICALSYARKDYLSPNVLLGLFNFALAIFLYLSAKNKVGTEFFATAYFVGFPVQALLLTLSYWAKYRIGFQMAWLNRNELHKLLAYSSLSLMANVVFLLVYRIDLWFVSQYRSPEELGNYIQASKIGQMLLIVPQIMASVVYPQTAEGKENENIKSGIAMSARLFLQLFCLFGLMSWCFGDNIFRFVFGKSFSLMALPFLILIPGIYALSILSMLSAYFGGKDRIRVNLNGALLALAVMVFGNLLFTKSFGIRSAACISTLAYSVNLCYSMFIFRKSETGTAITEFFVPEMSDYKKIVSLLKKNGQ